MTDDIVWKVQTQFLLGRTRTSLAKEFGVSRRTVYRILSGKRVRVKETRMVDEGKKCPKCGADGTAYKGEHETAVRTVETQNGVTVVDVGWRCNCGCEWGFEYEADGRPVRQETDS